MKNLILVLLAVGAVFYGGYKFFNWLNQPQPEAGQIIEIKEDEWIKGQDSAPITLIEYSDFACPACKNYFPIVKRLIEEFGDNLRFAYRHYPTVLASAPSYTSFRAAEAAGKPAKVWEM